MTPQTIDTLIAALPKAELHLHLEGSVEPATVVELAARHGLALTAEEAAGRYAYRDFSGFLEAFKWVTSFLRTPADYALIAERLAGRLLAQNVVYAEVTLSVGVMLRRKQDPLANFAAILASGEEARKKGLRIQWIFDAARQFGASAAMEAARMAAQAKSGGVVAFGMGGDETAFPAADFRRVYDFVAAQGLHRLVHAGEVGGPESVLEAVQVLGAERIGHGIAAMRHERTMDFLAARQIPLEVCPTSNIATGALALQLGRPEASLEDHPLAGFLARGLCVTLGTDDPAMFHTDLHNEFRVAHGMGLHSAELRRLAEAGFRCAFLPTEEKRRLLDAFRAKTTAPRLI